MESNQAIGIFDSGVGGLTVAKEIKRIMPNENIIYFGDSKHLPYGDKSKETVIEYSERITNFLLSKNCKAIVIACNTASANAFRSVKKLVDGKSLVFDVISPVADKIGFEIHSKIGVIATKATVNSHIYKRSILKRNPHLKVHELATPLLAPMIEEGFYNHEISKVILKTYLNSSKFSDIDTIILGCTHYPLIHNEVRNFFNNSVNVVDSPSIVANYIKHELQQNNLLNTTEITPTFSFYLSDITKNFKRIAKMMFGKTIDFELIDLK
ncbi:MAG: glutamate racemase [Flavobacteriales bacterium]|nr:glutamate racemase [Flavobacteriales bacterium]